MRATVLLANDGDRPDPVVASTACDLARRLGARLYVVHVAQRATSKIPPYTVLATLVAQCASAGGLVTRANLRLGTPDREILAEAAEVGAGLIVLSGRDRHPAQRRQDDALGACLGRRADCPVLMVRDDEPGKCRARLTIGGTGAPRLHHAGSRRAVAGSEVRDEPPAILQAAGAAAPALPVAPADERFDAPADLHWMEEWA